MERTLYSAVVVQHDDTHTLRITNHTLATTQTIPLSQDAVNQLPQYLQMLDMLRDSEP